MSRIATLTLWLLAGLSAASAQEPASVPGLYDRPVLAIDPGMHTGMISRADVDRDGRYVVTGSYDKTVRVWSMADGRLLRTIRLPAGLGNVGKAYAVAMSPDGTLIAVGGWTRGTKADPQEQICLFDRATGGMVARIEGLFTQTNRLAFSPDGQFLAALLFGTNGGLRVYARGVKGWAETARDTDYGGGSYGASFAPDGRLVTTSFDGQIRLYGADFELITKVQAAGGKQPYGIAFSPDGGRLAVGYEDTTAVSLLDGHSLASLPAPDTAGIDNGDLAEVAWSADGAMLYAAGRYLHSGRRVQAWTDAGSGPRRELSAGDNTLMTLRPQADGDLLVATQDPYLARLGMDGAVRWQQRPRQADLSGQEETLAVSADGQQVDFGYESWGQSPARFDLTRLMLQIDPPSDGATQAPRQTGLPIVGWKATFAPTLADAPLALNQYEWSRSLAIHPDGQRFVLGTNWSLRAFAADGKPLWRQSAPSVVWALNITGDGRLVVAAYGDGTIRWHQMSDGKELLAFFPLADRKRWVAWTPEGYYAAAPGTAEVLGWQVNRGWDHPADFYPITSYGGFYQDRALPLLLQELDTARALGIAKIAYDRRQVQELTHSPAPPGPQLHVLAVGISDYADPRLKLDFADKDAHDITSALLGQEGGVYAKVNAQYLINGEATRKGVFDGLRTLRRNMQEGQQDVAVILFSGHGTELDGDYYLLPADADPDDPLASGIEIGQLKRALEQLGERGKVLVLLDACHSGNLTGGAKDVTPPDIEAVRDELAAAGNGVVVLTSSSGRELSRESPDWKHGAFTMAALEALQGKADTDGDTWLSVSEIEGYVVRRVRELTGNQQNPRISVLGEHAFETRLFMAGR